MTIMLSAQSDNTRILDLCPVGRACKEPDKVCIEISEVESVYLRLPSELGTTLHCLTRASSTNFISNVPVIELFTFLSLSLFLALSASSASLLHLILLDKTGFDI